MNGIQKNLAGLAIFLVLSPASFAGELSLGAQFNTWNADTINPNNGWELWSPLSLSFKVDPGLGFYGQTEYGRGSYTDSTFGTNTQNLTNFSDSVVGTELNFKMFNVPSVLNVGFNIPTGDPGWEQKQIAASVPTEFVNSRYRGRGFGISAMYAMAFPAGGAQVGAAAGYLYSGTYNPNFGTGASAADLKLGDTVFLSFNHVQPFAGNQSQIIRLSGLYSMTTEIDGQNVLRMGPNLNASYSWRNPAAFSFDLGLQYFFPGQRQFGTVFTDEKQSYYGTRFYVAPSYAFGDFILAAQVKYILPNGYTQGDPALYNGGGYMAGLEPTLRLRFDEVSALRFYAGYDFILAQNGGTAPDGSLTNVTYNNWTFGTAYELKL